jgi:HSP90 family molecular chaperone
LEVKEESEKAEEAKPKTETITEEHWEYEVQNQQKAIWTRSAEDIEEEEYFKFYHSLSHGQEDPACYTHFKTDGGVEFKSILFAPKKAPQGMLENYYKAKSNSLSLYVRRVLISD